MLWNVIFHFVHDFIWPFCRWVCIRVFTHKNGIKMTWNSAVKNFPILTLEIILANHWFIQPEYLIDREVFENEILHVRRFSEFEKSDKLQYKSTFVAMVVKVLIQKRSYKWSRLIKTQHLWDFPQKIVWQVEWSKKPRTTEIWIGSLVGLAVL